MEKKELRRSRGEIASQDLKNYERYSKEDLVILLNSDIAVLRSVSARLLQNISLDEETIKILLSALSKEKALYTKMELCETLKTTGIFGAGLMVHYLGQIGSNQHKKPGTVSKKKSYPLPRDIIARTLGYMGAEVLPVLYEILDSGDISKISEGLDAIGFITFYSKNTEVYGYFEKIENLYEKYRFCELILWKTAMCCSSFKTEKSKELLKKMLVEQNHPMIRQEIQRSMALLF